MLPLSSSATVPSTCYTAHLPKLSVRSLPVEIQDIIKNDFLDSPEQQAFFKVLAVLTNNDEPVEQVKILEILRAYPLAPPFQNILFEILTMATRNGEPLDSLDLKLHLLHKRIPPEYHQDFVKSEDRWRELALDQLKLLLDSDQPDQVVKKSAFFRLLFLICDPEIFDVLKNRIQQNSVLKQKLLHWVQRSKTEEVQPVAAPALTLLVKAGINLEGQNFNGIRVPGADLSGGIFNHTQFQRANLNGVNFRGAQLFEANLEQANLFKVNFGELPTIEVGSMIGDCCYSPNGQWLAVGTENGEELYQENDGRWHAPRGHAGDIASVHFSPDGKYFASGGMDGDVTLWSVESGEGLCQIGRREEGDMVMSISFSPNGEFLAVGLLEESLQVWLMESEYRQHYYIELEKHTDSLNSVPLSHESQPVNSVAFSPDSQILAAGGQHGRIKLWDMESGKALHTLQGHNSDVRNVKFSPDGKLLAAATEDNLTTLWRVEDGVASYTFRGHSAIINGLSFSPDGKILASGSQDKTVRLWKMSDLKTGLHWNSFPTELNVTYMSIQSAQNLSPIDKHLLKQRGARGEPAPTFSEETHAENVLAEQLSTLTL
ncbi:pentapeptide repeat-containing protein [Mycoavidus sp. B2-EB]|uniref:WD40 repeat domain-containing protein n=1 Tax=Mycoavidus sp. B2-EB TaxID=2651972 RepID=UPI001E492D2A|nr:pentapeptide repeat-containing protein [Mycoavidus sp. B2-EB]BBO59426.1 hypothetical protein MPB2EB_0544 [Mycoavidus sp. B2-EB]